MAVVLQLTELEVRGIANIDAVIHPDKCNLLVGENGCGKTKEMQSIQLAVRGSTSLGERLEATAQLMRESECFVRMKLSDGFEFKRGLRRSPDGRVSEWIEIYGNKETRVKSLDHTIKNHCGSIAETFDTKLFSSQSAEKQRNFVADLCGRYQKSAQLDVDGIVRRITMEWLRAELGTGTVDVAADMHAGTPDELVMLLMGRVAADRAMAFREIIAEVREDIAGELTDSIGAALAKAKLIENQTRAARNEAQAAHARLSERKQAMRIVSATVEALKSERDKLIGLREELTGQIENQRGREESVRQAETRLLMLESEIKRMQSTLAAATVPAAADADRLAGAAADLREHPGHAADRLSLAPDSAAAGMLATLAKLRERVAALRAEPSGPGNTELQAAIEERTKLESAIQPIPSRDAADAAVRRANDAYLDARRKRDESGTRLYAAEQAVTMAEAELESHAAGPWSRALNLLTTLIETLPDAAHRAMHGHESWATLNKLQSLIEENAGVGRRNELMAAADAARRRRDEAKAELDAAETALTAAAKVVDDAAADASAINAEMQRVQLANSDLLPRIGEAVRRVESIRAAQNAAAGRTAEIERLVAEIARTEKAAAETLAADLTHRANNIRQAIQLHESNLATLERKRADHLAAQKHLNELRSSGGWVAIDELENQRKALSDQIATVDSDIDAKARYQALESELARAVAAAEAEGVRHETAKSIAGAIRSLRDGLMGELVKPLLSRMNHFLAVAAPGRVAYCELEQVKGETVKPVFEIGWIVDGTYRVPLPALSGGESALFGAALAYALVCIANPPLRLLLIEAAEVDANHMTRLLEALRAVADDVGNIFVATCDESFAVDLDGWNRIVLHPVEAEAVTV